MSVSVAVLCGGCGSDPHASFAKLLENAASWSASVTFAGDMARQEYVPRAYIHDLLTTASEELDRLATQIDEAKAVDPAARAQASGACRELTALLRDADRGGTLPDPAALRAREQRLRAAAQAARRAS